MITGNVREAAREDARRQHRSLAMYCSLFCWYHNKQAVYVSKDLFLQFIGLERLKDIRFQWVQEDVNPYFQFAFIRAARTETTSDLMVLSKLPEDELLKSTEVAIHFKPSIFKLAEIYKKKSDLLLSLSDEPQDNASKIIEEAFPYISSILNPYEYAISNTLSLLSSGLIDAKQAFKLA